MYRFCVIMLVLSLVGCGSKQDPMASFIHTVLYVPGVVLSIPNTILSGNPNYTKDAIVNGYNQIIGEPVVNHTPTHAASSPTYNIAQENAWITTHHMETGPSGVPHEVVNTYFDPVTQTTRPAY